MNNYVYKNEEWKAPSYKAKCDSEDWNEVLVDTAGFVPLEVRFKQMEQAGIKRQFFESDFTSSDLRSIYLDPDFTFDETAELEEIQEKTEAQKRYIEQLIKQKSQSVTDLERRERAKALKDVVENAKSTESTEKSVDNLELGE